MSPPPLAIAAVAAGGAIGASLRFLTVAWIGRLAPGFPWGTLAVNVLGSALMGLLAVALMERFPGSWGRMAPFLLTGVLGGFTTFSAFSLDALTLIERGRGLAAAAYAAASVGLAVGALWAGLKLGRAIWGP
ncbi:fluoride efflux transporter CrcB [Paralimibaculum aggregatum]|uniref:Fluoride-specific ion channel FluC n=1 Tax=Paralimibaculum aggregatum TaxID=3036245 RepID=A0ABQ6LKS9_9RHOB|nr:fluoride efflux transporter CrcB [Limibaculum sp. NKW23]GMG83851.1 fluoride efflux transporter CrcB [Limibaculum sp. NKW23]